MKHQTQDEPTTRSLKLLSIFVDGVEQIQPLYDLPDELTKDKDICTVEALTKTRVKFGQRKVKYSNILKSYSSGRQDAQKQGSH